MAGFSDYYENKIIDHLLRNQSFTPPTTIYLALFTAAPSDSGGGTECTGGSYARKSITLSAASGGATSNSSDITFTNMPTCTVTHFGIYDASSSGNLLMWDALTASKSLTAGDAFVVAAGDLDITVD